MLRFRLFGFPVTVQWFFWIVMALLGRTLTAQTPEDFKKALIFVACGFVSILAHELGHAYFQRRYGGRPRIVLHGFGGYAQSEGAFGRTQSLVITAAGPAASIALGIVFWLIILRNFNYLDATDGRKHFFPPPDMNVYVVHLIRVMAWINLVWGTLNLLPILPLDGGRLLEHFMGGRNMPLRAKVGFVTALLVVVAALFGRQIFMAALFGYLAYLNYQMAQHRPVYDVFTNSRY